MQHAAVARDLALPGAAKTLNELSNFLIEAAGARGSD